MPGISVRQISMCAGFWMVITIVIIYSYALQSSGNISRVIGRQRSIARFKQTVTNYNYSRNILSRTRYPITNGPYLLNNPNICATDTPLHFFVHINSAPSHFEHRRNIRLTYANENAYTNIRIKHAFFIGRSAESKLESLIENESVNNGDIVQGDFADTYQNLTHKTALGIRWIHDHCRHAQLILKADDDVFLNIIEIYTTILSISKPTDKNITCLARSKSIIFRSGKWKLDSNYFRNFAYFPMTHCNGGAVIFSPRLVISLLRGMLYTPFLWLDDVYVFGILASKISGVEFVSFGQRFTTSVERVNMCFSSNLTCDILAAHIKGQGLNELFWFKYIQNLSPEGKMYINDNFFWNISRT